VLSITLKILLAFGLLVLINSCAYMIPLAMKDKATPSIHVLIRKNQFKAVEQLPAENRSLANSIEPGIMGDTPLTAAAYDKINGSRFIRLLLQYGADPNLGTKFSGDKYTGCLPLEIAIASASYESSKILLDNGADPNALIKTAGQHFIPLARAVLKL
jgi:ankyrin repeat protein